MFHQCSYTSFSFFLLRYLTHPSWIRSCSYLPLYVQVFTALLKPNLNVVLCQFMDISRCNNYCFQKYCVLFNKTTTIKTNGLATKTVMQIIGDEVILLEYLSNVVYNKLFHNVMLVLVENRQVNQANMWIKRTQNTDTASRFSRKVLLILQRIKQSTEY